MMYFFSKNDLKCFTANAAFNKTATANPYVHVLKILDGTSSEIIFVFLKRFFSMSDFVVTELFVQDMSLV